MTIRIPNSTSTWTKECELRVYLINEKEKLPAQAEDKDVMNNYYRVRTAEIMIEAKRLAEKDDHKSGKKLLKQWAEKLSLTSVRNEPMVVGLLEDIKNTIKDMEPMIYETSGRYRLIQQTASHYV